MGGMRTRTRASLGAMIRPLVAAVVITAALVAPVAAFTGFTLQTIEGDFAERARAERRDVAQLTAHLVDVALDGAGRDLARVSSRSSLRDALARRDAPAAGRDLSELRAAGSYSSAALISGQGVLIARDPAADEAVGMDVSDRDYFTGALAASSWYVSEAYLARVTGPAPLASVSLAVRDAGRVVGVLQVAFTPQQIVSAIRPLRPGAGREIIVADGRARIVASTNLLHAPLSVLEASFADARSGPAGSGRGSLEGKERDFTYVPISTGDWTLYVADDPALTLAPERQLAGEITLAASVAGLVGLVLAIAFAILYRALLAAGAVIREQAITDDLTGLYNRRFLDTQLRMLDTAASRSGRGYAILAMDLDGLKRVNDAFGHQAGDRALQEFARALVSSLRGSDVAVRAGGDEFLALLPDTELPEARAAGERVRTAVARHYATAPEMALGVSVGIAEWRDGRSAEDVLTAADELLYAGKRAGRGRVVCEPGPRLVPAMEA